MNVLVYIHGGGFMLGSGNSAYPDYILQDDDIVFVNFNYRLGVLGNAAYRQVNLKLKLSCTKNTHNRFLQR